MPRSGEGTRRSTSPVYDLATIGTTDDQGARTQYWKDQTTGQLYAVIFGTSLTFETSDVTNIKGLGGLRVNPPYSVWIANGSMEFGTTPPTTYPSYLPVPPEIDLQVIDGELTYTPAS